MRGEPSVFAREDSESAIREPEARSLGSSRLPEPSVRQSRDDSLLEPFARHAFSANLSEPADARPYHSTAVQTDVVFIPYEPLPDGNLAVEQMDGVGYGSYASAVRSPLSHYLTKRLQLPDYDHNRDPKSVAAPTFD